MGGLRPPDFKQDPGQYTFKNGGGYIYSKKTYLHSQKPQFISRRPLSQTIIKALRGARGEECRGPDIPHKTQMRPE